MAPTAIMNMQRKKAPTPSVLLHGLILPDDLSDSVAEEGGQRISRRHPGADHKETRRIEY
jgi:hypothetical protein